MEVETPTLADAPTSDTRGPTSSPDGKLPMRDIIVVLPGIMGSVLKKDGKVVWGINGSVLWSMLVDQKDLIDTLAPEGDDVDDGVEATALLDGINNIPGFHAANGYKPLMEFLKRNVEVEEGINLFPFPYDWRKDNRLAAEKLDVLLKKALAHWRLTHPDAKVILIGHSMGGLVSRYWLEVLGGWKDCRALITLGTPHRGSLNAVDFLANGIELAGLNLTKVARSCTSIFQLLPIYACVKLKQGSFEALKNANLPNVNLQRVLKALNFHAEIRAGVEKRSGQAGGYRLFPVAGTHQKTNQSASWKPGTAKVTLSQEVPFGDTHLQDGDNTVPLISAAPLELKVSDLASFNETHGSLQVNRDILAQVWEYLRATQVTGEDQARARSHARQPDAPALRIEHSSVVKPGQAVRFQVVHHNSVQEETLHATLTHIETGAVTTVALKDEGKGLRGQVKQLPPGGYRVEVQSSDPTEHSPRPVHSVLEVLPSQAKTKRSMKKAP